MNLFLLLVKCLMYVYSDPCNYVILHSWPRKRQNQSLMLCYVCSSIKFSFYQRREADSYIYITYGFTFHFTRLCCFATMHFISKQFIRKKGKYKTWSKLGGHVNDLLCTLTANLACVTIVNEYDYRYPGRIKCKWYGSCILQGYLFQKKITDWKLISISPKDESFVYIIHSKFNTSRWSECNNKVISMISTFTSNFLL